ncbi:DUF4328 domain-containing protein [Nonomuraea sp. NPDC059194]|uniref:protein kinase domain-containing protein n=1 Tax=Nonomuraea sp. NPDC059194 TaxID=3346764 RepID=UPI0036A09171
MLAGGLVRALQDVHGAGLVHRDFKPSNILVTLDGPRVIDFGIARALDTVVDGQLTHTGAVMGSPGFMASEQVHGQRVTPAGDVFCLGAVLAFAATGRMPFGNADSGAYAIMYRIITGEPDLAGIPEGPLRQLITRCLDKDPARRPELAELADATRPFMDDTGTWLPAALTARLGQQAARLLDAELPQAGVGVPGAGALGTGPGGRGAALGSWFVPVAHLWIPKQIIDDIWFASLPADDAGTSPARLSRGRGARRRPGPSRAVLHAWWAVWATQLAMLYLSRSWLTWDQAPDAASALAIEAFVLVGGVLTVASAVLAVLVVQRLTRFQDERLAGVAGAQGFG